MGTPLHAYDHRADNKLYRLQTPQSPLVRPASYEAYNFDEYPLGTNTVVAVISYTVSFLVVHSVPECLKNFKSFLIRELHYACVFQVKEFHYALKT